MCKNDDYHTQLELTGGATMMRFLKILVGVFLGVSSLAVVAKAQVRIVAVGDSSIRGKGVADAYTFPAQLERAFRARGHSVTVQNEGINGDTTTGVLGRLDAAVPPGTHIVILAVGVNDKVYRGLPDTQIRANNFEIIRRLKARGIKVHFIHPGLGANGMQVGIYDRRDLHVESAPTPGRTEWHLNAQGYAVVVQRNLATIENMVRRAARQQATR